MADNVVITPGTGNTVAADEVVDTTLGTVKVQYVKIMDGTLDSTTKAAVGSNGMKTDGSGVTQPISASSLPLPTGAALEAGNLATVASAIKLEDAVSADGDPGVPLLTVRRDTAASSAGTTGDYATLNTDNTGRLWVNVAAITAASQPLPTGASTAAKQPTLGTAGTPSTDIISVQGVAGGTAQPVSAASLPLPTGAATSANQSTEITSLSSIATNTGASSTSANQTNGNQKTQVTALPNDPTATTGTITTQDLVSVSTTAGSYAGVAMVTGTPTASSFVTMVISGLSSVRIQILGTWTGTLSLEKSADGGTTWTTSSWNAQGSVYTVGTTTGNGMYDSSAGAATNVRVRATTAITGTANIRIQPGYGVEATRIINPVRIVDNASGATMTVKSGSTAPLATDSAVVVALSPNTNLGSGQPTINGEQNDFTGTFTNATQTTSVTATNLDGYGNVLISINGTYGVATAVFEGSDDSGTTWYAVDAAQTSGNVIEGGYTTLTNITRSWQVNVPGFDSIRVRSTAVASGTVNVRMSASATNGSDGATIGIAGDIPGIGATNLGKAEDAAHTSGDTGVFALGVRNDGAATVFSDTNGDYTPIGVESDGSIHVVQKAQTSTSSSVAGSATSVTLLSANNARKGGSIYNDSTAILYVKFGTTASTTSFKVPLAASTYYEIPAGYVGRIDGIWASATGNARIAEET